MIKYQKKYIIKLIILIEFFSILYHLESYYNLNKGCFKILYLS